MFCVCNSIVSTVLQLLLLIIFFNILQILQMLVMSFREQLPFNWHSFFVLNLQVGKICTGGLRIVCVCNLLLVSCSRWISSCFFFYYFCWMYCGKYSVGGVLFMNLLNIFLKFVFKHLLHGRLHSVILVFLLAFFVRSI